MFPSAGASIKRHAAPMAPVLRSKFSDFIPGNRGDNGDSLRGAWSNAAVRQRDAPQRVRVREKRGGPPWPLGDSDVWLLRRLRDGGRRIAAQE